LKSRYGWQAVRYLWVREDQVAGAISVLRRRLPGGFSMHYAPRGPVVDGQFLEWPEMWTELRRRLFQAGGILLRVDPEWTGPEGLAVLRSTGAEPALAIQHQATSLLDLTGGEEVFARMSPSARRNMRKAEQAGVTVEVSHSLEAIDDFYPILYETGRRRAFPVRAKSYYLDLLDIFRQRGQASVYLARYRGEVVAGSLIMCYGSKLIYLFSGATGLGLQVKAAYLVQQRAIRDAQARGLTTYDLWGIPLDPSQQHPAWGYSHFKERLGGKPVRFIGSFDLPVSRPLTLAFRLAERASNRPMNLTVSF
jgi:lipid II:glycine glycyltransferase (peptidoglycan interpeptide bridge formation enzyme)